jgi:hypothetical protein
MEDVLAHLDTQLVRKSCGELQLQLEGGIRVHGHLLVLVSLLVIFLVILLVIFLLSMAQV